MDDLSLMLLLILGNSKNLDFDVTIGVIALHIRELEAADYLQRQSLRCFLNRWINHEWTFNLMNGNGSWASEQYLYNIQYVYMYS